MAKTLPTTYTAPSAANLTRGEVILASDYEDIVEAQHYFHARAGNRIGGIVFDPPWQTTSLSYTTTNSNATTPNRNMDTWAGVFLPLRPTGNATGNARIHIAAYGADYDIEYTVIRLDTGATVTSSSITKDETYEWFSTTINIAYSTYSAIPLQVTFRARFNNQLTLCEIFQISVHSDLYTSTAYLPTT